MYGSRVDSPAAAPNPSPRMPASTSAHARLSPAQVETYFREGYLVYAQPVFPDAKFAALKGYFEGILADLPAGARPEAMDVPHFMHPKLLDWACSDEVLDLVQPILGPDIALFSTHFICKPKGTGRRVPWHEDSSYWKGTLSPIEVCTVWLAIDPSLRENGCMQIIPRTHREGHKGFSDYDQVDATKNVFPTEIRQTQRDPSKAVFVELQPNQCSLHDGRIIHGSEPNMSDMRRCGYTMRFCSTKVKFVYERFDGAHVVYLARGRDLAGNHYADPTKAYPDVMKKRGISSMYKNSH